MPNQSGRPAGPPIERVVVDECLGPNSPMLPQLAERLGSRPVEVVILAAQHPGIPDIEILDKLLDGRTALLTRDRALHNLAIARGFRSFAQTADGGLTQRQLPGVACTDKRRPCIRGLRNNYLPELDAELQAITGCLTGFLSEHQLKQFRTKRRRIRAYFGSLDNIAATALTIGQIRTPQGTVGGCQLKVDAPHDVKGLSPASESYFLDCSPRDEPLRSVVWALAQVFMLQLQNRRLTLYLCDAAAVGQLASSPAGSYSPLAHAVGRLFAEVCEVRVQPCVKGRFFDRMQAKLDQLARGQSHELVPIDVQAMASALVEAQIIAHLKP